MKIKFWKDDGVIELIPDKKYPNGYNLEISFGKEYVCFSIGDMHSSMSNVQLSYKEFGKLLKLLNMRIVETEISGI